MKNRIETKVLDIVLLPVKLAIAVVLFLFGPSPPVRVLEHPDGLGYRLDACPDGCCPHFDGLARESDPPSFFGYVEGDPPVVLPVSLP
jgi:hypothetical protein